MKYNLLLLLFVTSLLTFSQENTINLKSNDNKDTPEVVSFSIIEKVPVYKGCDENMGSQALKECFDERLNALIIKNFNTDIARNLDLPDQSIQRILVTFKINQEGKIIDIEAKTNYPKLEAEAIRVINLIPTFKSGYFKEDPVTVPYSVPIKFQVSNPKSSSNTKFAVYRGCNENLNYEALKECTTNKVKDFLKVSIDYELADKLFPTDKTTQFLVSFTINKKGKAEKITAKAHKIEMAAEVINVLKRMPKFKATGYANGKPVDTKMEFLMTIHF